MKQLKEQTEKVIMLNMTTDSLYIQGLRIIEKEEVGGVLLKEKSATILKQQIQKIKKRIASPLIIAIKADATTPIVNLDPTLLKRVDNDSLAYYYGSLYGNYLRAIGASMYITPSLVLGSKMSYTIEQNLTAYKSKQIQRDKLFWQGLHHSKIIGIHDLSENYSLSKKNLSTEIKNYREDHHPDSDHLWKGTAYNYNHSGATSKTIQQILKDPVHFSTYCFIDINNLSEIHSNSKIRNISQNSILNGNQMIVLKPQQWKIVDKIAQRLAKHSESSFKLKSTSKNIFELYKWSKTKNTISLSRLNSIKKVYSQNLYEESIVLIKDSNRLVPTNNLGQKHFTCITFEKDSIPHFTQRLKSYTHIEDFHISSNVNYKEVNTFLSQLPKKTQIILGLKGFDHHSVENLKIITRVLDEKNIILVWFGDAKALTNATLLDDDISVVLASGKNTLAQDIVAQSVMGANKINGILSNTLSPIYTQGYGLTRKNSGRLGFSTPEYENINSTQLTAKIDSLAKLGILEKAYPGCQILIAKDNHVIFHQTYGYHTYKKNIEVKKDDIYDWASITKVTGPTIPIMQLYEKHKISLDEPYSTYWQLWKNSNKKDIPLRDILAHQGQLKPYLPLWNSTMDRQGKFKRDVVHRHKSKNYNLKIAPNLYIKNSFKDTVYSEITQSELLDKKKYTYSGLAFFTFPRMIELITKTNYEKYLRDSIYRPLGATTVTYNPYKYFAHNRYVPTENDRFFRKRLIVGYVHDEGAALMGGVSGNAGLFGDIIDCAKIFQMFLNNGKYGDKQFVQPSTIKEFTKQQFPENENRRGLAFDKPLINNSDKSMEECYPAYGCSSDSFGHGGFTGTFAWADPKGKVLFIFFSNRVYPTRKDRILYELNLRPQMQQVIYNLIDSIDYKRELG
ncbi:serine hydrolase [Halosquirtibacter laminarini]|uniref:Serine hydrolase n=1 Tax=Halosquirtibacter laminarini TaxID=3374600 RepID=A0AC61NNK7_9BACT|nr:serine hydrolase [Prolixibacteraceae bacterium]